MTNNSNTNNTSNNNSISAATLAQLHKLGFKLVPLLLKHNNKPAIEWTPIYNNPNYWTIEELTRRSVEFKNVVTVFGKTHKKDSRGRDLYLANLDCDSEPVYKLLTKPIIELHEVLQLMVKTMLSELETSYSYLLDKEKMKTTTVLDILKQNTVVVKTRKPYGFHAYWLSHTQHENISTKNCKPGHEFEIKTDKSSGHATLPPSTHRNDKIFRYTHIGRTDRIVIADALYDMLTCLLQECIKEQQQPQQQQHQRPRSETRYDLSKGMINVSITDLKPYYIVGHRHDFILPFSGFAWYCRISEDSAAKILSGLATSTNDEEIESRLQTLHTTYEKGNNGEEITGKPTLVELIAQITNCDPKVAQQRLDSLQLLWYHDMDISLFSREGERRSSRQNEERDNNKDHHHNNNNNNNHSHHRRISVSDALMCNEGKVTVRGKIMACSGKFKMVSTTQYQCFNDKCLYHATVRHIRPFIVTSDKPENSKCPICGKSTATTKHMFITAIQLELQDVDNPSEIDRLVAYLFEENTRSLKVGETVLIDGNICVVNKNDNRRNKFVAVLYGNSIFYENRQELSLTKEDKQGITTLYNKYSDNGKYNDGWINYLLSLFAPNIARNYYPKLGVLLSATSSGPDQVFRKRDRVHVLIVGDPGLAKTILLYDATRLVANSKYMSMSNTSGISLTAMIEKDEIAGGGGGYNLRIGSIPLAKNAIFAANEIGELNFKNQLYLGDIMEEGVANISKYTVDAEIIAPVTMISACNPIGTYWKFDDHIELTEIPLPIKEIDRYDLHFFIRMPRKKEDLAQFAKEIVQCEKDHLLPIDYTLLQKIILYAQTFKPKLADKAIEAIEFAWIEFATVRGSVRIKNILERLTKAFAKLKFKSIGDVEDANDAIALYKHTMSQYDNSVVLPKNPAHAAAIACAEILQKNPEVAQTPGELIQLACHQDQQVDTYLSDKSNMRLKTNHKLRNILDILLQNKNIKQIKRRPVTLQWIEEVKDEQEKHGSGVGDVGDLNDANDIDSDKLNKNIENAKPTISTTDIKNIGNTTEECKSSTTNGVNFTSEASDHNAIDDKNISTRQNTPSLTSLRSLTNTKLYDNNVENNNSKSIQEERKQQQQNQESNSGSNNSHGFKIKHSPKAHIFRAYTNEELTK